MSTTIVVRRATVDDAELLFRWANDPETRRQSFSTDPIPWETHVAWLSRRLADEGTVLLVGELAGEPIGTVRFDIGHAIVISVTVAPEHRGRGVGRALIVAGCREVKHRPIVAEILRENIASQRAFVAAGFRAVLGDQGRAATFILVTTA